MLCCLKLKQPVEQKFLDKIILALCFLESQLQEIDLEHQRMLHLN